MFTIDSSIMRERDPSIHTYIRRLVYNIYGRIYMGNKIKMNELRCELMQYLEEIEYTLCKWGDKKQNRNAV